MDRTAYLDEAFSAGPVGLYVVAAVLVPPARADGLRFDLRQLFRGRTRRFHWNREDEAARQRMLEFIADRDLSAVCVTTCLRDVRAQERARALSLERVLWELRPMGVRRLVLEARQERNNLRDRRVIAAAQRAGKASAELTYGFGLPSSDPLLWTADAVASAVLAAEAEVDSSTIATIQHIVQRLTV